MRSLSLIMTMLVPVLAAVYTANYARWAWRERYRLGAVGLFLLALLTVLVPTLVLWLTA